MQTSTPEYKTNVRRYANVRVPLLLAMLAGCAPGVRKPPPPVPDRVARPITPVASIATPAPEPVQPVEPVDDLEPRLEHDEVAGVGITVKVTWMTLTGTTHVAEDLVFSTSRGELHMTSDEESGETLPLFEQAHAAGKHRWVVLGWSSYGGGMQTGHAWIVDGSSTPRIVDKLEWTTDRRHAGLVFDLRNKVRIGIPLPQRSAAGGVDDDEHLLHNELDWKLVHGTKSLTLAQVAKLPSRASHVMAVRTYTPPLQSSASERGWSGRFVWFVADKRFVKVLPGPGFL